MNNSFQNTLKYLYDLQFFGMKLGLDNIRDLLESLDNPQRSFPAIHVAGTNGKGSTCAMIEAIFRAAGFRTGLYTSPHLFHFSERIQVNGEAISEADIVRLTDTMRIRIDELKCTFFEATTAMAFEYFKEQKVDIGIIETGLGGRLDATNVIDPVLSVITNIDLEHTEHLGKTIGSIAFEKAGIIKTHRPCLAGPVDNTVKAVFDKMAGTSQSSIFYLDTIALLSNPELDIDGSVMDLEINHRNKNTSFRKLYIGLAGKHQLNNAALAVSAVIIQDKLPVSEDTIRLGLKNVSWNARLQTIQKQPYIIADAAHNPAGIKVLSEAIAKIYKPKFEKLFLIIGMLADKDYEEAAAILAPHFSEIVTITPRNERALPAAKLAEIFQKFHGHSEQAESLEVAIAGIKKKMSSKDLLIITGSHFVLSELKNIMRPS